MGEISIMLAFDDKSITKISGFPFGEEVYNKQGKNRIDPTACNIISFPEYIDYVGSSFIQGFIATILDHLENKDELLDHIKFQSTNKNVQDKIYRDIYMWMS